MSSIFLINKNNYINYIDIMQDIFENIDSIVNAINNEDNCDNIDEDEFETISSFMERYTNQFGFFEVDILLLRGKTADIILQESTIFACTVLWEGRPCCLIVERGQQDLLCRVVVHELCHAKRMIYMNVKSEAEYIKYLDKVINQIFEEMLAISTEKNFSPNLNWEEIIEIDSHSEYLFYEQDLFEYTICSVFDIESFVRRHRLSSGVIYYIAYYLSKHFQLDIYIDRMMLYQSSIAAFDFLFGLCI